MSVSNLTMWERSALKSGANLLRQPNKKWKWNFGLVESGGHESSEDAARSFLRWNRTGRFETVTPSSPVVEAQKMMRPIRQTVSGIPMQVRRCSLRPALEIAVAELERLAQSTPELREQFKMQANEARAWLLCLDDYADFIVLVD